MPKRQVPPAETLSADTQAFFDVLNNEPDFSVVVVSCAYLDACLGSILEKHFLTNSATEKLLDVRSGALGFFVARADVCYSLGLIPKKIYQDLQVLATIRNLVAHHHLMLSFTSPEVAKECGSLKYAEMFERWDRDDGERMFKPEQLDDTRTRFVWTVVLMSQRLLLIALGVKRVDKPKFRDCFFNLILWYAEICSGERKQGKISKFDGRHVHNTAIFGVISTF